MSNPIHTVLYGDDYFNSPSRYPLEIDKMHTVRVGVEVSIRVQRYIDIYEAIRKLAVNGDLSRYRSVYICIQKPS